MAVIHRMAHRLVYQTQIGLSIPKRTKSGPFFAFHPPAAGARPPARLTGGANVDKMEMICGRLRPQGNMGATATVRFMEQAAADKTRRKKHFSIGGQRDVNMTEGNIVRHLTDFAVPLLIGNIFQQLYNTVDTWVVGNYVSNEAFSAVGTVGPIINMLIGFFLGLSSGASVVIAQYYGANRRDKVHDAVHTAIFMTLLLGVAFTVLGILLVPTMLGFMKTPADVFPASSEYLVIYFAGVIGLMIYNIGSGILRAVGDSTRPFYFLVVSAVINTALDLVFVLVFHMGVAGVALATVIAQAVSALLVVLTLMHSHTCIRLRLRDLRIHFDMLKKILLVGIPAAVQMAITSFSNVFVQSYINVFGSDCMSGWTAYSKIDQLIVLPMQSIALAATTFVGQNLGSGRTDRAQRGTRIAVLMSMATTFLVMVPVLIAAPALVTFFNRKAEVIAYGSLFLRVISPFYLVMCIYQVYAGALRGAGNSRVPMIIMLASFVAFRQCYLFIMTRYISNEILPIAFSYPAGWLVCSGLMLLYYRKMRLGRSSLLERENAAPSAGNCPG